MLAICIRPPYARAITELGKLYETRGRNCKYRGRIAILEGQEPMECNREAFPSEYLVPVGSGNIIATADLTDCIKMTSEFIAEQSADEIARGLWSIGRYALKLENIRVLDNPVSARGMPSTLFNTDYEEA